MNLHAFYNLDHIGDVLLVRLTDSAKVDKYERNDDLCVLYQDNQVIGYNLFHASQHISQLTQGKVKITVDFVNEMNQVLEKYQQSHVESDYDDGFHVGKIIDIQEHPDSDHMHICQVDVGSETLQIVCGAPNVALNQLVVVAKPGAVMPSGLVIKPSQLRGIPSSGMLCSARELALANAPQVRGILVLDEKDYQVGDSFFQ